MANRKTQPPGDSFEISDAAVVRLAKVGSLTVLTSVALLIAWMVIAPVDEIARAPGAVEPVSSVQRLQSEFGGAVGAVHVQKGEVVEADQLLIEFDATEVLSQLREARISAFSLALERERLLALVETRAPDFGPIRTRAEKPTFSSLPQVPRDRNLGLPVDLVDLAVSREQAAFEARQQLLENQQSIIHKQINVTRAEMEAVKAERPAVERQLLVAKERVAIQEGLVERGLASRAELVEAIEVEANYDYRLAELTGRFAVLQAQIKEFEERLEEIDLADRRRAHDRIIEVNATLYEITERIARLIRRVVQTEFRAPVAGIVLSLPETVSGRFIEAGELVAEIVPLGVSLQFVAKLSPRDVGFVASGQSASLKIDSFDFSRYGALTGVVSDVSPTTIVDDKGAAFYEVLIEIPKAYFRDDPEQFALLPGMTGEADILTGKKTVFEYVWKPIYTNLDRALTER